MITIPMFIHIVTAGFAILYGFKVLQTATSVVRFKKLCEEYGYHDEITPEELGNDLIVFSFTFVLLVTLSIVFFVIG